MKLLRLAFLLGSVLMSFSATLGGPRVPITDLFNTGVDANGQSLADNSVDPHYIFAVPHPLTGTVPIVNTSATGFPIAPAWAWLGRRGRVYLAADDGTNGTQLWRVVCPPARRARRGHPAAGIGPRETGGMPFLVKDHYPGPGDGEPYYLTSVGGTLFFQAFRPDTGIELWRSDGTDAGTTLVRDIEPAPAIPTRTTSPTWTAWPYFVAYTWANGTELWRSDGTEDGTHIVRDIRPGWASSYPTQLTPFGGQLYFAAFHEFGSALLETDGTDAQAIFEYAPDVMATLGDALYFISYAPDLYWPMRALWRSDGTKAGTVPIDAPFLGPSGNPSRTGSSPPGPTSSSARTGAALAQRRHRRRHHPRQPGRCESAGPHAGGRRPLLLRHDERHWARALAEQRHAGRHVPGRRSQSRHRGRHAGSADGRAGHRLLLGHRWATGFELWKSDGTAPAPPRARHRPDRRHGPSYFQAMGDLLYFTAHNPSFGYELWRSDGTPEGTAIVRNLNLVRRSYPESPADVGGTLFFYADDGRFGDELWALETPTTTTTTTASPSSTVPGASTSTTTTPAPPPTSSTLPREVCGNCLDDDGDGNVDFEDAACCTTQGQLALGTVRVKPHDGGSTLKLKGVLGGFDLPAAGSADLVLQLRNDKDPSWCARIPASGLRAAKRGLRFDDADATVASANGLERVRLVRAKRGGKNVAISGDDTSFAAAAGDVDVTIALVDADGAACVSSSATLRPSRRGGLATGR